MSKKWGWLFLLLIIHLPMNAGIPKFYGEMKKVAVGNAAIAYFRFGQGQPLVMVTGHGDTMLTWHPQLLKSLSRHHEIIMFDYPGIGQSTIKGSYPDSMNQLSDLVHGFVQTQGLKNPDILGFSMGGSVVLKLMTQHGKYYNRAIAVGGKAGGPETVPPEEKYFKMLSDPNLSPEQAVRTLLFPPSARNLANAYLESLASIPMEKMDKAALQAQAKAVQDENNGKGIMTQLSHVNNSVMIMNGTEDVLTPVINAQRISNAINDSWLVRVKGAGHGVLFQYPEHSAQLIDLFFAPVRPGNSSIG